MIETKPVSDWWSYNATIGQTRDESSSSASHEAYTTKVSIKSRSYTQLGLNFVLNQTFTNKDFSTGDELMTLVHPSLTAIVSSNWTSNSFLKTVMFHPDPASATDKEEFMDNKVVVSFRDQPGDEHVSMTVLISREIFNDYKALFNRSVEDSFVASPAPYRVEL
jgi:hypothetical protein